MNKLTNILNNNKCLKLICAAGNENIKEIEKLSYVYSLAGFNMIDVSAKQETINAVKNGLKRAGKENAVLICVSVGMQNDIHLTKAVANRQKCINCSSCITVCPQNAIYMEDEKIQINEKNCIGCSKCKDKCSFDAIITEHKYKTPWEMLLPIISENIDCVEFHCTSSDEDAIIDSFNKIKSLYKGCLSICLDRSKLGDDKLINLIKKMSENEDFIMLQADGKPMSGGEDNYKSTLQSVAFGELIRNSGLNVYLILSGGTNSKTSKLAKECNVDIDGVALGSFARKIVKDYIGTDDFFENEELQRLAVNKAEELANCIKEYF